MIEKIKHNLTFTVSLSLSAHQKAQEFSSQHRVEHKIKQVYLNTLAVYAVNYYLNCLGIATNLAASNSWNPVMQTLTNTADLEIKNLGKIECLPVLPGADICQVSPEVWSERIGYVAVQFDQSLAQATLIGFVSEVNREELPLNELASLEYLLEYLNHQPSVVKLSDWINNIFADGWSQVETYLQPQKIALSFRNLPSLTTKVEPRQRAKLLKLTPRGEEVILLVKIAPTTGLEMEIWVDIYPYGEEIYLPEDLQLMVLNDNEEVVMQAIAKQTENVQLQFSGEIGESFSVKVALGESSISESFII
ncbi:DUF1822 family protein [Oscillatoria salina]|uniref:DUF1822 family protein n=1 Tax=Oscillatoria salina TaxID=331517 RepID=UPI001CCBD1E6|nr:DUF1822 family protein [Oscillatoria salina]MBZ8180747.1 DUF1822 family protein [Oscillatoria salina IIICB1]